MDLLNKYLAAIGKHLPEGERDDILQELSANLTAEVDDTEASLGRPLTEDELADVISRQGHPIIVASRFAPQRYLIGPTLFPIYWNVLCRALPIAALVYAVASACLVAARVERAGEAALRFPGVLFTVAAWVTLVFAAGEFGIRQRNWDFGKLHRWNPRDLPKAGQSQREPRIKVYAVFAASLLGTAWVAAVPYFPYLLLGPGAAYLNLIPVRPAPFWGMLYWPVVILFLARSVLDFGSGMWPLWRQHRPWAEAVLHGITLVLLAIILQQGQYFILIADRADSNQYGGVVAGLNQAVVIAVAVTAVISVAEIAVAARRMIAEARGRRFARPSA